MSITLEESNGGGGGIVGHLPYAYGIDPTLLPNLIVLVDQAHPRSTGDSQTWNDIAHLLRGDNTNRDFEQKTAGNQPSLNATNRDFDGNDFMQQTEIDDETGITAHQLATVATGARYNATGLDMSQYATASGTRQYRIVFGDAAGKKAWAYIGGADSTEATSNKYTSDFSAGADGWTGNNATADGNIDGIIGEDDNLRYTCTNTATTYLTKNSGLTVGKTYRIRFSYYIPAAQAITGIYFWNVSVFLGTFTIVGSWVDVDEYFTMVGGADFRVYTTGGVQVNEVFYLRNMIIDEVTSFGPTAAKLYSTPSGATQSLTGNTGIDPNAISTIEAYRVLGTTNLTGDQAHGIVVKLDDGRPVTAEALFAIDSNVAGTRSLYAQLETTGKVTLYASEDGTNYESVTTDAAVFADGAQSVFTNLLFVLDKTNGTGAIYVNGSAVAVTETITTGALLDTYAPLMIGSKNGALYLNGQVGFYAPFADTITAMQVLQMHNAIRGSFGI